MPVGALHVNAILAMQGCAAMEIYVVVDSGARTVFVDETDDTLGESRLVYQTGASLVSGVSSEGSVVCQWIVR